MLRALIITPIHCHELWIIIMNYESHLAGCWDEEVLVQIVHYLLEGNRDMKQDILKAMIIGKNIQFIDKRMKTFKDVVRVLSLLCKCSDPEDKISFHAAVALGKMCVMDDNATRKLRGMFDKSQNAHRKAEVDFQCLYI